MKKKSKSDNVEVVTFGCRLNAYESEVIKSALKDSKENIIVFNSCAVTNEAERELRQSLRRIRKSNADAKIVVTGCAAQISPEKYAAMEEVDLVLGNEEKSKAENYKFQRKGSDPLIDNRTVKFDESQLSIKGSDPFNQHKDVVFFSQKKKNDARNFLSEKDSAKILVNNIMSVRETAPQLVSYFDDQTRAFLEIQNGCNHRCTFCIIPYGRGNSRSVAFGDIATQVKTMVAAGHREVVLTGVDISDYGKDLDVPLNLLGMVKRLLNLVPELKRLRLSSIDVAEIDDQIFDLLRNEPRFMPHLHLSLQSGDDMILKRMKRRHNRKQVIEFCRKVREIRPDVAFGADIIAGFPTETDEMFENSVDLMKEVGIVFAHIFPYSAREGTPAAKMPQLSGDIIKKRAKILRQIGEENLQRFLQQQVGTVQKVIIEKNGIGKTENFLNVKIKKGSDPLIDNRTVKFEDSQLLIKGSDPFLVKITGVEGFNLVGTINH